MAIGIRELLSQSCTSLISQDESVKVSSLNMRFVELILNYLILYVVRFEIDGGTIGLTLLGIDPFLLFLLQMNGAHHSRWVGGNGRRMETMMSPCDSQ